MARLSGIAFGLRADRRAMREFQRAAVTALGAMLQRWGIDFRWMETRAGPLPALNYGPHDVDLHAQFAIGDGHGEVWIYPDGLWGKLLGEVRIAEEQDFPGDPQAQIRTFCRQLQELRDRRGSSARQ